MDQEFHYWITGIVARRAGFSDKDASIIAHAAQLVDDNDMRCSIEDPNGGEPYEVYISQTMNILKPKRELMRIYPIFHFLPGLPAARSARRGDGKMHILTTTPDSKLARAVLRDALATKNPYRIGVAAHTFADTWAHQNFVGWTDGINGWKLKPAPNIGHADFMHHPDMVNHSWKDPRILAGSVDNNQRFLEAARRLFEEFSTTTQRPDPAGWEQLREDLHDAMAPVAGGQIMGENLRLAAYKELFSGLSDYDEDAWFDGAVTIHASSLSDRWFRNIPLLGRWFQDLTVFKDSYTWKTSWKDSHWYKFQEAVKAQQAYCMAALKPLFEQMGVDLRTH